MKNIVNEISTINEGGAIMKTIYKFALVFMMAVSFALTGCSGDSINEYKKERILVDNSPTPDNTAPSVLSAEALDKATVVARFNEIVDKTSAEAAENYHIQGNNRVNVLSAVLGSDEVTVTLTVSTGYDYGMQHGKEYTLLVQRVADMNNNTILNAFTNFTGKGSVVADIYNGTVKMPLTSPYPIYNVRDFTLTISGTNVGSYQYSFDNSAWSSEVNISTPISLYSLSEGAHTLKVVGRNNSTGEWQDVNFATATSFIIDTVSPVTTLENLPAAVTNSRLVNITVNSTDATAYRYRLNNDEWSDYVPISNSIVYTELRDRDYTLEVQGIDDAGNVETTVNSYSWTVSESQPAVMINNSPASFTKLRNINLSISGNNVLYYKYTFNGFTSELLSIDQVISYRDLADGTYALEVTGYSSQDESSAGTPVTLTWTVDNVVPVCTLSNLPLTPTNSQQTYIMVGSAAGDVVKYRYRVNNGAISGLYDVSSPLELNALPQGEYKIEVFGVDAAGNQQADASGTVWNWTVDITSPRVVLENLPAKSSAVNHAAIRVTGTDVKAYKYLLDSGTLTNEITLAESGIISLTGLADGYHTISVIGRDQAGNWQSLRDATEYTWLIDTNAPTATITDYPAAVSNKTSNITFTVAGIGVVKYRYSLDSDSNYGVEYDRFTQSSIVLGDGNPQSQYPDPLSTGIHTLYVIGCDSSGNWQSASSSTVTKYTWTIDTGVPEAVLTGTPPSETKLNSISIIVTGVAKYKYNLDQQGWSGEITADAANPIAATGLTEGGHTLSVIGADAYDKWQSITSPTTLAWIVDTTPPVAEFKSLPNSITSSSVSSFTITGNGVYAYRYYIDSGTYGVQKFMSESQVITTGALDNGSHTIHVKGIDQAGNEQTSETTYTWTVDSTTPAAVLNGLPSALTKETSINISVNCTNIVSYKYKLDSADWSIEFDSTSSITRVGLSAGSHSIQVLAKNSAGTWQIIPTSYSWTIDVTPPTADDIILSNLPANPTNLTTASITVGGSIAAYQYQLDGGAWGSETLTSEKITLSGLGSTSHTIKVIGKDTAGNWTDRSAAKSYTWVIETVDNPVAEIKGTPNSLTSVTGVDLTIIGTGLTKYIYSIDSGAWSAEIDIATHIILTGLSDGLHTIRVRGMNGSYTQTTATEFSWTIDTVAPVAVLADTPADGTYDTSININVGGTDVVAYQYSFDNVNWIPDGSEKSADYNIVVSGLSLGSHTIYVRARDNTMDAVLNYSNWQGNTGQPAVTSYTWTIVEPPITSPAVFDSGNNSNNASLNFSWTLPGSAADVKIQIASNSSFADDTIIYGGHDGISIGLVNGYTYAVTSQTIKTYYARVSVNTASGVPVTDASWKDWGSASDGISIVGGIKGVIINALTKAVVEGATIELFDNTNTRISTATSDTGSGNFAFVNVPVAQLSPNTSYHLSVSMTGYGTTSKSNIVVVIGQDTDLGRIYLMPDGATSSTISGTIIDANDGAFIYSATVTIYDGDQNVVYTTTLGSSVNTFTTPSLNAGIYTMVLSKSGYFSLQVDNIIVNGSDGAEALGRQAMCKELTEPQVRVVVLWGFTPSDLDLHLVGPTNVTPADGAPANRFLVYWSNHKSYSEKTGTFSNSGDPSGTTYTASLVRDVTAGYDNGDGTSGGYGPEAINLFRAAGVQYVRGLYTYTLRDWTNQSDPTAAKWLAYPITMRVYDSQGLVREINFPSVAADVNCWKAIKINILGNSRSQRYINVVNQFGNIADSSKSGMDW